MNVPLLLVKSEVTDSLWLRLTIIVTVMVLFIAAKLPREFGLVPNKALTIMQGHSASIVCYASFETFPFSLTWEKQTTSGSYVSVDPSMVKRDQSNQRVEEILTIANAKLSDSGNYKCTVAGEHLSTFRQTLVQVNGKLMRGLHQAASSRKKKKCCCRPYHSATALLKVICWVLKTNKLIRVQFPP